MLQLILAPPGCGKSEEIRNMILQRHEQGMRGMVLIVPEQISFDTERSMLRLLGAKCTESVEVLSFSRFCDKFFEQYGGRVKRRIDDMGKSALMQLSVRQLRDGLKLYSRQISSPAFTERLIQLNTQMKRFCVTPEAMRKSSERQNGILFEKLSEFSLIMAQFERSLDSEYYDPIDDLTKIAKMLDDKQYFADKTVFLDSFNGFTPQQLPIIGKIIAQANETVISLCLDKNDTAEGSVYSGMKRTAESLRKMARESGVRVLPDITQSSFSRYKNDEMKCVAKYSFAAESYEYEGEAHNVHVATLRDIYEECDYVAANIRRLTREKGIRYREIAVIARDTEKYNGIIERSLAANGIPCFIDAKKSAMGTAMVRFTLNALQAARNYSTDCILTMLKTGITSIDDNDVMQLDGYCTVWGISGDDWTVDFIGAPSGNTAELNDDEKAQLEKINAVRAVIADNLTRLHNAEQKGGALNISTALYYFIIGMGADKGLSAFCDRLRKSGKNTEADVQQSAYDLVISLLDQLVMALEKYNADYNAYFDMLVSAANGADIGRLPQGLDEIAVGSAVRMRPRSPRVTFIIGANDGEFPSVFSGGGLFSDSELITLKNDGLELSCYDEQRAADEAFLAFTAAASPSEQLFVTSYKAGGLNGANTPSEIITRLINIFGEQIVDCGYGGVDTIECKADALAEFGRQMCMSSQAHSDLLRYFTENPCDEAENMQNVSSVKNTHIDPEVAKELFGKDIYLSASRVDNFYHCSFGYFCKYGLKISPNKQVDVDNLQRGSLIHLAFCRFVEKYSVADYRNMSSLQREAEIRNAANELLGSFIAVKKTDNIKQYHINSLCKTIGRMLDIIYDELEQTEFEKLDAEMTFGNSEDADFGELTIDLPNGAKAHLSGQIDRVDVFEKNGEQYVRVIDYKTSSTEFRLADVLYGQNLQMLLYLSAYKRLRKQRDDEDILPAGVLYMHVAEPSNKPSSRCTKTPEQVRTERKKAMKMNGILLDDESSLTAMEPDFGGVFAPTLINKDGSITAKSVYTLSQYDMLAKYMDKLIVNMSEMLHTGDIAINPLDGKNPACHYCDYKDVCRRDQNEPCTKIEQISDEQAFEIIEKEADGE